MRLRILSLLALALLLFTWQVCGGIERAAASTKTLTSRSDFDAGILTHTETASKEGDLDLEGNGTWNSRVWRTPFLTLNDGTAFATDGTYTYMLIARDTRFVRYTPTQDKWVQLASSPVMPYQGSDMTVIGDNIYVSFGGYQREFYKYSISANTWTQLDNMPDLVTSGSSLSNDGVNVYALHGAATTDFWKYSPSTDTWSTLTGTPATISTGADLIYDNSTGPAYFYTPRGSNTTTFYRYDISGGTWSTMTSSPGTLNDNGNITKFGDYIYVLRGSNTATFYRYSISGDSWTTLSDTPAANRYVGLTYNALEGYIYVFRGNNTYDWWKYDLTTDSFLGPTDLPATPGNGADLVYYNSEVYYRRGNNSTAFYNYNTSTGAWTTLAVSPAAVNDDTKGIKAGSYLYYFRGSNTTSFYRYDPNGDSWSTLGVTPANVSYGSSLAYPGSGNYIYGTRGGLTTSFWRYNISGDSWDDAGVADLPTGASVGYGSRLVSDGTDIYAITGSGIAKIYKYSVSGNSWTSLGNVPFAPYWGTDVVYNNGKIYAQSGYYKTELWEYTIATNTWRRLPDMTGYYAYELGPYNGGSLAVDPTNNGTLYSINGQNITRLLSFSIAATNYPTAGTWVSDPQDLTYVANWEGLSSSVSTPADSSITFETRTSADKSSWSSWQSVSGGIIDSPVGRYLQLRVTLHSSTNQVQTPVLHSVTVTYTGDTTAPNNPTTITGVSQQVGGSSLTSGNSYPYSHPYLSWSGATDTESTIAGYYVYFGSDNTADPESDGTFQTATSYTVISPLITGTYYLRIKTKDAAGNISNAFSAFTYTYAGVSPPQSVTRTTTADFSNGTSTNTSVLGNQIKLASRSGFWEQSRLSLAPSTMYYGASFAYVAGSGKLYTFRGNNSTTFYEYDISSDTWTTLSTAPATVYQGGDLVEGPSGYLYAFPGKNTNSFWRYDIANNSWDDAAVADAPGTLYYGSSMIYDGSRYIYVLRGNNDDAFWRYDTQTDSWDTLANTDFGATTYQQNNNVYIGGDLTYDGDDTIYAVQAGAHTGFASYSISTDSWTRLTNTPVLPYDGSQIAYDSGTTAVYFTSGWTNPFFYKYSLSDQTWSVLPESPAPMAGGSSIRNVNGTLYVLRGANTNAFWKYDIAKASWKIPTVGLFGTAFRGTDYRTFGYGSQIVKGDGNYYYLTRGNYDNLFVRYDASTGESVQMAQVPSGFYTGSAITYDNTNGKIYVVGSQYDQNFYVYDIATDTWSTLSSDPLPITSSSGSSLEYDGSRYIYWIRGGGTTTFYRYDTQAQEGHRWSNALSGAPGSLSYGAHLVYNGGYIYTLRGNNIANNPFYRYDPSGNSWMTLAPLSIDVYNDGWLVDGGNNYLYACKGENTASCYRYSISGNSWEAIDDAPAQIYQGGAADSNKSDRIYVIAGTGTNTYTDGLYSYVIQSDTSSFEESGTYTSGTLDLSSTYQYADLSVSYTPGQNSTLGAETRSSSDGSIWSDWQDSQLAQTTASTKRFLVKSSPARYLQVRFSLSSSDGVYSDVINDYTVSYYQDSTPPVNPSSISTYTSATHSALLMTDSWYNYSSPNFTWPQAEEAGGATDTTTGSGVSGYYVYFGTNASADPQSAGVLQTADSYTPQNLTSGNTYYLRIKTVDNAGNVSSGVWQPFIYKYDNVAPENPTTVTADPPGYTATNSFDFAWSGATDSASLVTSYCYKTILNGAETCGVTDDFINNVSAGGTGASTFYVKAVDAAGNKATSFASVSYYYSSTAPSAPQNLSVTPTSNTINEFAFSWTPPSLYFGAQANLLYYYSVNAIPTSSNVNSVGLSHTYLSAGSYATVPGNNIMYVVAKDEAGNIDYSNYASVTFNADTSAPGVARNVDISDVSVKSTENWRLAVSWDAPQSSGSGVSNYKVYRTTSKTAVCSIDFTPFSYVASTTSESYVDTGLTQQNYAYCIKACDSTNNCSAVSSTVTLYPDGKWTTAPTLTASPSAVVKTKSATVSWSTNRTSNSFVKYGTKSGEYGDEVGSSDQVAAHSITLSGLNPGTTYYYKVLWTDEDGNLGESDEQTLSTNAAPFISGVKVTNISLYSAYVSFTVKNASSVSVNFGKSTAYGGIKTITTPTSEETENILLDNLEEGTEYHLQVVGKDEEGNTFSGDDYSFQTLPIPKVTNAKVQQVANMPTATLRAIWTTNTPISTIVTYYPSANPELSHDQISLKLSKNHEMILTNLKDDTQYTVLLKGKDSAGNAAEAPAQIVKTAVDFRPPDLLNVNVESTIVGVGEDAKAQVIISWDTDEPSTSQVDYAQGTGTNYGQSTQEDTNLSTNHVVTITNLTPAKIYHLQAISKDKAGNIGKSFDTVVVTPKSTKAALNLVIENLSKTFGFLKGFGGNP